MKIKGVTVLGSTGSIGRNALDVIRRLRGYRLSGASSQRRLDLLARQARRFRPEAVCVPTPAEAELLSARLNSGVRVWHGPEGLVRLARAPFTDILLSAVSGAAGLRPLLAALSAGKRVALANKEALVMAGELVRRTARRFGAELLPVDSEHSAMFQCLLGHRRPAGRGIRRIWLTASGGPFYRRSGRLSRVTPEEALRHPTWRMGRKITVDSATLMNKGLEALETHFLFDVPLEKIRIVIHPQSIVHSAVEFEDGSVLAQMSLPDMRLPIQYAITYPDRAPSPVRPLSLPEIRRLDFGEPDFRRFPCLSLALEAGRKGRTYPTALSAADEVAVAEFLNRRIRFTDIPSVVEEAMRRHRPGDPLSLSDILKADAEARAHAAEAVRRREMGVRG